MMLIIIACLLLATPPMVPQSAAMDAVPTGQAHHGTATDAHAAHASALEEVCSDGDCADVLALICCDDFQGHCSVTAMLGEAQLALRVDVAMSDLNAVHSDDLRSGRMTGADPPPPRA